MCTFAPAIRNKIGALVQLVRMPACHAGGHGFESRTHRLRSLQQQAFFVYCLFYSTHSKTIITIMKLLFKKALKYESREREDEK